MNRHLMMTQQVLLALWRLTGSCTDHSQRLGEVGRVRIEDILRDHGLTKGSGVPEEGTYGDADDSQG